MGERLTEWLQNVIRAFNEALKDRKKLLALCAAGGVLLTAVIVIVIILCIGGGKTGKDKPKQTETVMAEAETTTEETDTEDETTTDAEDTSGETQPEDDTTGEESTGNANNNATTANNGGGSNQATTAQGSNTPQGNAVKPVYVKPASGKVEAGDNKNISLTLTLFCTDKEAGKANNVQLNWTSLTKAAEYEIYRSLAQDGGYTLINKTKGTSYQDYNLEAGRTYYYKITAINGASRENSGIRYVKTSNIDRAKLNLLDNQQGSAIKYDTSGTIVNGIYYQWGTSRSGQGMYFWEKTSTDGIKFSNERIIIDSKSAPCLKSCKLEAVNIEYSEALGKVVIYAHWEIYGSDYSNGKAFIATGTPGGEFKFSECERPLGIQVRDMSLFFDDDGSGYLVSATNKAGEGANKSIRIFKLKADMSGVEKVMSVVHDNQYREAPHIIKLNGFYYMFTSQAAGWYPSAGAYASAASPGGPWTDAKPIGNNSTFSSQSGGIWTCGYNYLMMGNRWIRGDGTSPNSILPITFDNGYAYYDYFPYILYNNTTGEMYPVQLGQNVSQNKTVTADKGSKGDTPPANAVDGDYRTAYEGNGAEDWPVTINIDLGKIYDLTNIQISWLMHKGSEGYYTYTVEASEDGKFYKLLLDRMNEATTLVSKTYGFSSCLLSGKGRYIKLYVDKATLWNNPDNNWYNPTIYELKVFGTEAASQTPAMVMPTANGAVIDMNFETPPDRNYVANAGSCPIGGYLSGSAKLATDPEKGRCLQLDGRKGSYMKLPTGILNGNGQMTVSMDVKSESDGNFFTFALGQNNKKYFFFKVAKDSVRAAFTTNTWSEEKTHEAYKLNASSWHRYTFVLNGNKFDTYIDGDYKGRIETDASIADFGADATVLVGKSYYAPDAYFKGYIDNLKIYNYALSEAEVKAQ